MTRTHYDWEAAVAKARRLPGRWVVTHRDVPVGVVKRVRLGRHPALRPQGGALYARILNLYTDDAGRRRGDLALRFVPTPEGEPHGS